MVRFTIIPDIHADIERLNVSLQRTHKNSMILFLGDFVDASKDVTAASDLRVLETARKLIAEARARAVMGNHELNALLYHSAGPDGSPLRAHSSKNQRQHRSFIEAFGVGTPQALEWTDWFLETLPLWIEVDGLRISHACWSDLHISEIRKRRPDGFLKREDLAEIASGATPFGRAVKSLVTGPEVPLPEGCLFHDYHGNPRKEVRLAWWNAGARTWPQASLSVPNPDELPQSELPSDVIAAIYPMDAPPVLVGHYKMKGDPGIQHPKASSIDYPNTPCIYRWFGETELTSAHLISL
ncbi:Calcineurin-like phosphoesterase [Devosia enhydra]|uniref:Calcineurin-like phosphoesterase n=1 Tax=Devosia enhydra TaxID=665118 RepID=A0A1K2HZP4_9HYPH|nr:metallophosphoesterase [Devosia enhydra]SFZ85403.1 Calcineurin-like phosphoesterase [Devosia enhydra]